MLSDQPVSFGHKMRLIASRRLFRRIVGLVASGPPKLPVSQSGNLPLVYDEPANPVRNELGEFLFLISDRQKISPVHDFDTDIALTISSKARPDLDR